MLLREGGVGMGRFHEEQWSRPSGTLFPQLETSVWTLCLVESILTSLDVIFPHAGPFMPLPRALERSFVARR